MKCPHCLVQYHDASTVTPLGNSKEGYWYVSFQACPACNGGIVELQAHDSQTVTKSVRAYPRTSGRPPTPLEVPPSIAKDYSGACNTLLDSESASAALSRRCLQSVLRDPQAGNATPARLVDEIGQVVPRLPPYIVEGLDEVRHIGNFAAHPERNISTGEIIEVAPGEAESLLDTLEELFQFFYVRPVTMKRKKEALEKKLLDAGKRRPRQPGPRNGVTPPPAER
jgi:hypothetical protein